MEVHKQNERSFVLRSDAQRSAKQKERREQELEKCKFNAEIMEEPGLGLNMVSMDNEWWYLWLIYLMIPKSMNSGINLFMSSLLHRM